MSRLLTLYDTHQFTQTMPVTRFYTDTYIIFTARCYAERGDATVRRMSVCTSVTFRYDFQTGGILRK